MNRGMLALTGLLTAALAACSSPSQQAPTQPPAAGLTVVAQSHPTRVRIPTLNVDSNIIDLGIRPDGTMAVPPDAKDAGWFTSSPAPGERGPAVLAAHVNWKGVDGPFAHIDQLKPGDLVTVERDNGAAATFTVSRVERYAKSAFPAARVYADTAGPELRLITCGGTFDQKAHSYRDNIVVYAQATT